MCVQESVEITVKPLKCKAYLSTMSLVCVCVCVCVCVDIGICRNYSETTDAQGIPVDNVFVCIGITVKLLKCKVYLLTMSLCL